MADCISRPLAPPAEDHDMLLSCCSEDDDDSYRSMDDSDCSDDSLSIVTDDDDVDVEDPLPDDMTDTSTDDGDHSNSKDKAQTEVCLLQTIASLHSNHSDCSTLDLSFPMRNQVDFGHLLHGLRCNTTVTQCAIGIQCFQGLPVLQRRELADAICALPSLKCLTMDTVFPEFLFTFNCGRCWKRDQYYKQCQRYYEFRNETITEIRIRQIPFNIPEIPLGRLVMMTLAGFARLEQLDITFSDDFVSPPEGLMRVALTALSHSNHLEHVKFGYIQEDGEYTCIKELEGTRKDGILRLLKLRYPGDQLCEKAYKELADMLQVHSQSLKGLVLDTAFGNNGAVTIANTVGRNSNLKALCLGTFDCESEIAKDGLLSLLSRVLCPDNPTEGPRSGSLKYLSLVCQELDDSSVHQIAQILAQSSLRELMLFLDNVEDDAISSQGIAAFARLLEVNDTIAEFHLICNVLDDDGVIAIASLLERANRTLTTLRLQCTRALRVSSKGYEAIVHMLKSNSVLEDFDLSRSQDPDDELDDPTEALLDEASRHEFQYRIDLYLRLNRAGVRNLQLHSGATPSQFLGKVVSQRGDLDSLFYMLSNNPSFVAFGTGR
jgi:hypothetical protein